MIASLLDRHCERLKSAIRRLEKERRTDMGPRGLCALAGLRAYQAVFDQLKHAYLMHVAIESLQRNINEIARGLPSVDDHQVQISNDVPETLMLPTVWSLLRFSLKELLSNAAVSAQHAGGQVRVTASVKANTKERRCCIYLANQGTLPESARVSILQSRPVLRPDGQYGIGLLAAGKILTVLGGYLQYPKNQHGIVQAIAVLRLDGDAT